MISRRFLLVTGLGLLALGCGLAAWAVLLVVR